MKQQYLINALVCLLIAIGKQSLLQATGGIEINYESVRNAGMGHTGVGIYNHAASLSSNPGGMAFVRKAEFGTGGMGILSYTRLRGQFPSVYETVTPAQWNTPIYMYIATRLKGRFGKSSNWTMGIGYNSPFGVKSEWEKDWSGRFITQGFSVHSGMLQPTISYQVAERLGIGLGLLWMYADTHHARAVSFVGAPEGKMEMYGSSYGVGVNAGILLQANEHFSVGLNYRSPIKMHLKKGKIQYDLLDNGRNGLATSFEAKYRLPTTLKIGVAWRINEKWLFSIEANQQNRSEKDSISFQYDTILSESLRFPSQLYLRNSNTLRWGAEYRANPHWVWRLGGFYQISPLSEAYVAPYFLSANTIGLTMGGEYKWKYWAIQWSNGYHFTGERTFLYRPANFGGVFKQNAFTWGIGITYSLQ